MKDLAIIALVLFIACTANMAAQTVCFDQAEIPPGTILHIYDSSVTIPPGELSSRLSAVGGMKQTGSVEERTERWTELSHDGIRELSVSWSRYEQCLPGFIPDSLRTMPVLGACYSVRRYPEADTTMSRCDSSALVLPGERWLVNDFRKPDYPEILFRIFSGVCLDEAGMPQIQERVKRLLELYHAAGDVRMTDSISNVFVEWMPLQPDGTSHVTIAYRLTRDGAISGAQYTSDVATTLEADLEVETAHARDIKFSMVSNSRGHLNGQRTVENIVLRRETHTRVTWLIPEKAE
ncbi:MAG: hypothetical protein IH600_02845 [Bacteroidetes bacterium]|nr:hypothetical protein [Bacteroidota bacterium]